MQRTFIAIAALTLTSGLASTTLANPVDGLYFDGPFCDNHGLLQAREELGNAPLFPTDELIDSVATFTNAVACPMTDDPSIPNRLVQMTNLTGQSWTDLFYVADVDTTFSNEDGGATTDLVIGPGSIRTQAFKIDQAGMNRPLVFESMTLDGIFEPGETWQFIVQDYINAVNPNPADFSSLDFSGGSAGTPSSASIVQFVIPSPGSCALAGLGVLCAFRRRRN